MASPTARVVCPVGAAVVRLHHGGQGVSGYRIETTRGRTSSSRGGNTCSCAAATPPGADADPSPGCHRFV